MNHAQLIQTGLRAVAAFTLGVAQVLLAGPNEGAKYLDHGVLRYGGHTPGGANLLARMRPVPDLMELDARIGGELTGTRGTRLNVPPGAFVDGTGRSVAGKIQLELIEVIDAFDFATVGIDLTYRDPAGREFYFQSAGMFHLSARKNGSELRLARGRTIRVDFPGLGAGEFRVYNRAGTQGWIDKGQAPAPVAFGDSMLPGRGRAPEQRGAGPEKEDSYAQAAPSDFEEGVLRVGSRTIQIDGLEWWNFDSPYPHVACVKGSLSDPEGVLAPSFQIIAIGINYKGQFARHLEGRTFQINVHKSRQVKLLVVDSKGNVGVSDGIQTPDKNGFDKNPEGPDNLMLDVGTIAVRKVAEDVLKDRNAFQDYLGLPREYYQVQYPDPGRRGSPSP